MRTSLVLILLLAAIVAGRGSLGAGSERPASSVQRPAAAKPEQTVQIKLRDLLDAIPRKEAAEIAARLKGIEERLTAIEAKLPGVPTPVPLGTPR